jgi:hypothetical protein
VARALTTAAAFVLASALQAVAQTPAQIEAEPILKLQPGETAVPGECLTQQELDLLAGLRTLRRPTVGVEGDGDDQAPFNPHYFVGAWEVEGVLSESPLGESTEFYGTEVFRHVGECNYESTLKATTVGGDVTIESRLMYDRRASYLVRLEDDSRGVEFVKIGRIGGDPGGYYSHHWQAAPVTSQGQQVRLTGRTFMLSPFRYEIQTRISVDGGPFVNFGTVRWERAGEP